MIITREMMVKLLSEKSGYWQKDVRTLLQCLNDVMIELLSNVQEDEDLYVQLFEGCRLKAKVVKERERVDPRTQKPIICPNTVKLGVKYSDLFKRKIQDAYDHQGES